MIIELATMAFLSAPTKDVYVTPTAEQSISRPFEGLVERQLRIEKTIEELKKEHKANEELKSKDAEIKSKIKSESERIQQLKEELAAKEEQERINAEQARIAAAVAAQAQQVAQYAAPVYYPTQQPVAAPRAVSNAGNAYAWGNCTWHVKNMRPDIGSFWGNANAWFGSAQRDGFATGYQPRVGAIGVSFAGAAGHVVYITGVSADGRTITLSEMNYNGGVGVVNVRSDAAANYSYIY